MVAVRISVTRSKDEAIDLLIRYRRILIAYARHIAIQIARSKGTVHSRLVRAALAEKGLVRPQLGDCWLGAVFNGGPFVWTGALHEYEDRERNIHKKTVRVWRLSSDELVAEHEVASPAVLESLARDFIRSRF
jgi:hypothetical protein